MDLQMLQNLSVFLARVQLTGNEAVELVKIQQWIAQEGEKLKSSATPIPVEAPAEDKSE